MPPSPPATGARFPVVLAVCADGIAVLTALVRIVGNVAHAAHDTHAQMIKVAVFLNFMPFPTKQS